MTRRHQTLSFEDSSRQSPEEGRYDRSKLCNTPIGPYLTGVTHLVYGVENELRDFDDKLEKDLLKVDRKYRMAHDRYIRLKRMIAEKQLDENDPAMVTLKMVEQDLRQCREAIRYDVTDILLDAYKRAMAFVICYLDDDRLRELKWKVTQHAIAQVLYDNLDHYEDFYALGKGVRNLLAEEVMKIASAKGERIVKNLMPSKGLQGDQEELDKLIERTNRVSEPTLPGIGNTEIEAAINSRRQVIPRYKETLRPTFIPQSDAEIQAGAPTDPVEDKPVDKPRTIPYAGQLPPSPSGPEVYGHLERRPARAASPQLGYVPTKEEIKETEENAAAMARQVAEITRSNKLPDLSGLFNTDEFIDKSPAFEEISSAIRTEVQEETGTVSQVEATNVPRVEVPNEPELIVSLPIPNLANLEYDDEDFDEFEAEKTVDLQHLPGRHLPTANPLMPGSFSSTDHQGEAYASDGPRLLQPSPLGSTMSNLQKVVLRDDIAEEQRQLEATPAPETQRSTTRPSSRPTAPEVPLAKQEVQAPHQLPSLQTAMEDLEDTHKIKVQKKSWAESLKNAANRGWGWTKRNYKGAVLAASIALGIAGDTTAAKYLTDTTDKQPVPVDTNKVTPPAPIVVVAPPVVDQKPEPVVDKTPAPETVKMRTFGRTISNSKSPIVQDIITRGETKLGMSSVTDTMIDSFAGLASTEQLKELHELQKYINLGLGVYFNEHFGTPEKVKESIKDPKMRNLYRTARVAQAKGWFQSYHTKEKFPKSYALAVQILADSSELGLDESANTNTQVQDYVRGNMFQAKHPGNTIKLRKNNGQYHVIQDMVFDIFEGKTVSDMLDSRFAGVGNDKAAPGVDFSQGGQPKAPIIPQKLQKNDDAPKAPPALQPGLKPGQTGQIMPNIYQPKDLYFAPGQPTKDVLGYNQQQLLDEVDRGWDDVPEPKKPVVLTKAEQEMKEIDEGWDEMIKQAEAPKAPTLTKNEKVNAAALTEEEKEMKAVDDGWEEIGKTIDKLAEEKGHFEKTARVEFDLPLYFTTHQENQAIIPNLADKMAALYPQADGALIRKMIRQYGWIGCKLVSRERGHFVVELNKNFHKNILQPILQKKYSSNRLA